MGGLKGGFWLGVWGKEKGGKKGGKVSGHTRHARSRMSRVTHHQRFQQVACFRPARERAGAACGCGPAHALQRGELPPGPPPCGRQPPSSAALHQLQPMLPERRQGWHSSCDFPEHACIAFDAALSHGRIGGVQFDQDGVALEAISDKASGSGAAEGVQDGSACGATSLDAAFR